MLLHCCYMYSGEFKSSSFKKKSSKSSHSLLKTIQPAFQHERSPAAMLVPMNVGEFISLQKAFSKVASYSSCQQPFRTSHWPWCFSDSPVDLGWGRWDCICVVPLFPLREIPEDGIGKLLISPEGSLSCRIPQGFILSSLLLTSIWGHWGDNEIIWAVVSSAWRWFTALFSCQTRMVQSFCASSTWLKTYDGRWALQWTSNLHPEDIIYPCYSVLPLVRESELTVSGSSRFLSLSLGFRIGSMARSTVWI